MKQTFLSQRKIWGDFGHPKEMHRMILYDFLKSVKYRKKRTLNEMSLWNMNIMRSLSTTDISMKV